MALSRTALFLLLLPAPVAALYLATSMEDVNASGQCLPSAEAVKQQYPGSWASWTTHAANHKGEKCWFPASRENHSQHIEGALRRAAQTLMHKHQQGESDASKKAAAEEKPVSAPAEVNRVSSPAEVNRPGWNVRDRSANVVPAVDSGDIEKEGSSFDDRFAAARNVTSPQRPSLIQRMMDPGGALPNNP
jgi:hypothetical protein